MRIVKPLKLRVIERLLNRDSVDGVQRDHLPHQRKAVLVHAFVLALRGGRPELREGHLVVLHLHHVGPLLARGSPVLLEYLEYLVDFGVACEERPSLYQLRENAADGPDVDGEALVLGSEQDFWGAVPEGLNFVGQRGDRNVDGASEAEVSDFYDPVLAHEDVVRLQVAVEDFGAGGSSGCPEVSSTFTTI